MIHRAGRRLGMARSAALARLATCGFIALTGLGFQDAHATEGGGSVYPYGLNTVATGILPKPGHYLYVYNSYYTAKETTTNDGDESPRAVRRQRTRPHAALPRRPSHRQGLRRLRRLARRAALPRRRCQHRAARGLRHGLRRCRPGPDARLARTHAAFDRGDRPARTQRLLRQGQPVQPGPQLLGDHVVLRDHGPVRRTLRREPARQPDA